MLYFRLIVRGLQADECLCTRCVSRYVRLSRRRGPWLLRVLSLALFRCESCRGLFPLPRRFVSRLLDERNLSGT